VVAESAVSRGSVALSTGALFDGRFRIEERVAEGGFAVVYKAWQVALDRRVALKVLKPPRNQDEAGRAEFRDRFAIEARTIARLRHPHIVDVYDFSVATLASGELLPWMALEWLDGETLAAHLGKRKSAGSKGRDPAGAVEFLRPALEALAHAHEQGIAHRDIKPSNMMVVDGSAGSSLRVLDFGIAKIMVDDQTPNTGNTRTESAPAFSPAYAAPEQVAFSRTGPWTDVHALGLVLSELMTDEAPFSDPDPNAHLFEQIMARSRPTPAAKGRDVGPFEPVLEKALALAPRDRFRSAGELLRALDDAKANAHTFVALAGDTAPAIAVGTALPQAPRWKRKRSLALLGAAIAVVTAALVTPYLARGPRKEEVLPSALPRADIERPSAVTPHAAPATDGSAPPRASARDAATSALARERATADAPRAPSIATRPKARKAPVTAVPAATSAAPEIGDGRDLFNDTK